ncbi:Putative signal transducing protein [Arboricoccus pini]|uniref:Putative signal transducing protein n=1 Tax=Arboricoccus pini TaxID=1963835 RepID=A0A212QNE3_9PROT|nr:DUF2007 domain-containing protein [Arboricoccus pini]SNB60751.1 Putative signal transducing protein [Arboricoccus pini]
MLESLNSKDPVQILLIMAMLEKAGIDATLIDAHIRVLAGSLGISPRHVLVSADDLSRVQEVLAFMARCDP